jgi:hypothetical protein
MPEKREAKKNYERMVVISFRIKSLSSFAELARFSSSWMVI